MRSHIWLLLFLLPPILASCGNKAPLQATLNLKDSTELTGPLCSVERQSLVIAQTVRGIPIPIRISLDCISRIKVHTEKTYVLTGAIVGALAGIVMGACVPVQPGNASGLMVLGYMQAFGTIGSLAGALIGINIHAPDPVFATPFQNGSDKLRSYAYYPDDYPGTVDSTYHCR